MEYDVTIIGAGAAGMTAAVYASRAGLKVCMVEKAYAGGQFVNTAEIENMPAFDKISGYDLAMKMLSQTEKTSTVIMYDEVVSVELNTEMKSVSLANGEVLKSRYVIIATGANPRKLGVDGEDKYLGRGIHYCATCDGGFYRGKDVAIIGGGNTAVTDAKYLSRIAKTVYLIHRRDTLRAREAEVKQIETLTNVKIMYNSVVESILGDKGGLSGLKLRQVTDNSVSEIDVNAAFIAIGWIPNTEIFNNVERTKDGYIVCDSSMRTSLDGVYAVGDVRDKELRQIITAAADGAIAAESITLNITT